MKKEYLMGERDWLTRANAADGEKPTYISSKLDQALTKQALSISIGFYSEFFDQPEIDIDIDEIDNKYKKSFAQATSLNLFETGGIKRKDHLNMWCLGLVYKPETYVESGVFIGSSLHAFVDRPEVRKIIAIDPDLSNLKLPPALIPNAELIDSQDFSELDLDLSGSTSLLYFDDHIDTASRILQSYEKGATHLLFDDSTGLEGICQRLYPAMPTIPMIMNWELLSPGDELSWTYTRPSAGPLRDLARRVVKPNGASSSTRVTLTITEDLIEHCAQARKLIKKVAPLPDLGSFLPQIHPGRVIDTTKFLVELERP